MFLKETGGNRKYYLEKDIQNFSKCGENNKSTDTKSSWNPTTRNMKNTIVTHIIIKLLKPSDEVKVLKAARWKKKRS